MWWSGEGEEERDGLNAEHGEKKSGTAAGEHRESKDSYTSTSPVRRGTGAARDRQKGEVVVVEGGGGGDGEDQTW